MDKYTYMREMSRDGIRELLLKGGFCPERVDIRNGDCDESLEPFFDNEAVPSCECVGGSDRGICRECIREFLEEEIGCGE